MRTTAIKTSKINVQQNLNCGQQFVEQTISNSTDVTINSISGKIQTYGPIPASASYFFKVNNTCCTSNSVILVSCCQAPVGSQIPINGGTAYTVWAGEPTNGSFKIQIYNSLGINGSDKVLISFLLC